MDTGDSPTSPPLRVALVCPYSLSRPGGVQAQVVGLARALGTRGHRVTVFAPLDDPGDAPSGIDLVVTGRTVSVPANGSVAPVSLSIPAVVRARRTLQSVGFDVVHVHEPFAPGLRLRAAGRAGYPTAGGHLSPEWFELLLYRPRSGGPPVGRRFAVRCAVSEAARATASESASGGTYRVGFNGVEVDRYRDVDGGRPTGRPCSSSDGTRHARACRPPRCLRQPASGGRSRSDEGAAAPVLWIAGTAR